MAGIGFVLRKLYRQDNLSGFLSVGLHSTIAATGPWLFTVLALGIISVVSHKLVPLNTLFEFRTILIYNFSFSLVISGPVFMIATRYLADSIHRRDVSSIPDMLVGSLILLWAVELCIAGGFYFLYTTIPFTLAMSAVVNFLLVSAVWLMGIFISALKNYQLITRSFLFGMVAAVITTPLLSEPFGAVGMINGFSIGISIIIALLLSSILNEYPYPLKKIFAFLPYFRKYWEIAVGGVVYNLAIWVDKWIMWFAPEAITLQNGLRVYPDYDSAMFLAYMTTIPAMAMFLFNTETHFFERYMNFYKTIEQKGNFANIEQKHQSILHSIFGSAGYFFLLQGAIAFIGILIAPEIISLLNGNYLQIGILRYGLLGALFQVLTLFLLILLSYFDRRRISLSIQCAFLLMNTLFTWGSMYAGFQYYGYGYFLSCFTTFIIAAVVTTQSIYKLPYHTFISTNTSIR